MSNRLSYEELSTGDLWVSQARTITETDVVNFAGMTGDFDPLHVDHEHAANTPFGRPIAHGLLGLSLVAGLGSHSPAVDTVAFIGLRQWEFHNPLFIGDTVRVRTEVLKLQPSGRRRGRVTWKRELINQNDVVVQSGTFETLVALAAYKAKHRRDAAEPSIAPPTAQSRRFVG